MFGWLRKGKARELAEARVRVERAQRALLPLQPGLQPALAARLSAAERLWRDARASEERGDAQGATAALRRYEEARAELVAVRREVLARAPELGIAAVLALAEEDVTELEDEVLRAQAWMEVFGCRLGAGDFSGAQRMLAAAGSGVPVSTRLVRLLFQAEKETADADWIRAARARVARDLCAFTTDLTEGADDRLELALAQAEWGDRPGARATIATLEGEFRDQALLGLAGAEADAGDLDAARAAVAEMAGRDVRLRSEVRIVEALARRPDGEPAALAAARALSGEACSRALIHVVAARGRAGELERALALVGELEAPWHEEARLVLFAELLDRGDLAGAERVFESFDDDSRNYGWSLLAEARASRGDASGALAAAQEIDDRFGQAAALEELAWGLCARGDEPGGHELFARALALASEAARHGDHPRYPGRVDPRWIDLAERCQVALGDLTSPADRMELHGDPDERAVGWFNLGRACGRKRDFEALERLLAECDSPADRAWLRCGFVREARIEPMPAPAA